MNNNCLAIFEKENRPVLSAEGDCYELSLYQDAPATEEQIIICASRLRDNFPRQTAGFWAELQSQIKKMGFTGKRLADATDYVIQNHKYDLRIADLVQFNKSRKIYTYAQMVEQINKNGGTTDDFEITDILDARGKRMWVAKSANSINNH